MKLCTRLKFLFRNHHFVVMRVGDYVTTYNDYTAAKIRPDHDYYECKGVIIRFVV